VEKKFLQKKKKKKRKKFFGELKKTFLFCLILTNLEKDPSYTSPTTIWLNQDFITKLPHLGGFAHMSTKTFILILKWDNGDNVRLWLPSFLKEAVPCYTAFSYRRFLLLRICPIFYISFIPLWN